MLLRQQSRTVFGLVLVLQLATAFGAIALLARMGPAIATVAEENVESLTATERMLAALAAPADETARRSYLEACARAEENVTEEEERPLLAVVRRDGESALAGDPGARQRTLQALEKLAEVNRDALRQSDREAQRLARAGAWAAAFLALISFLFMRLAASRIDRLFVMPILEIANVLAAASKGDFYRRCSGHASGPEIQAIADGVNRLLDGRLLDERASRGETPVTGSR